VSVPRCPEKNIDVRSTCPFGFFGWYVNPLSPSESIGSIALVGATASRICAVDASAASRDCMTM